MPEPIDHIPRIDIAEFRRLGYLQEVNRRFLHPLGLALEVIHADDGSERLGGVWDYRDDPEGIVFTDVDHKQAAYIDLQWEGRRQARINVLGWMVQPSDTDA